MRKQTFQFQIVAPTIGHPEYEFFSPFFGNAERRVFQAYKGMITKYASNVTFWTAHEKNLIPVTFNITVTRRKFGFWHRVTVEVKPDLVKPLL